MPPKRKVSTAKPNMNLDTRGQKILNKLKHVPVRDEETLQYKLKHVPVKDEETLQCLRMPKYESTKGLDKEERKIALSAFADGNAVTQDDGRSGSKTEAVNISVAETVQPQSRENVTCVSAEARGGQPSSPQYHHDNYSQHHPYQLEFAIGDESPSSNKLDPAETKNQVDNQERGRSKRNAQNVNYKEDEADDLCDFSVSEDEYQPSESESSHSSSTDDDTQMQRSKETTNITTQEKETCRVIGDSNEQSFRATPSTSTFTPLPHTQATTENTLGEMTQNSEKKITVSVPKCDDKGKRIWDKKLFCVFCKEYKKNKLAKHFEQKHKEELEVAQFLSLPKRSKERKELITKLVNRGYFMHNQSVFAKGEGEMIPKKRSKAIKSPSKLLPCEICGASFSRRELHKHSQVCRAKNNIAKHNGRDRTLAQRCAMMFSSTKTYSEVMSKVIVLMKEDEVTKVILNDPLLLRWGEQLYSKYGHKTKQHRIIVNRLREVGRLVIEINKIKPEFTGFMDVFKSTMYKVVRDAVYSVAGYDKETGLFKIPSLARKIGQSIRKLATVCKGMCLEQGIEPDTNGISNFFYLMDLNWPDDVEQKVDRTFRSLQRNKEKPTPLANDVQKIHHFLEGRDKELKETVLKDRSLQVYNDLVETTLVRVILLNFRRPGESESMFKEEYMKSTINEAAEEELEDPLEQVIAKTWKRVEVEGKAKKNVPVLFTPNMQNSVDILLELREELKGGLENNPYLFASAKHKLGFYRAGDLLRKFALNCGARQPNKLKCTNLRKYVATMTTLLNLRENELDSLAKFMGHDIRVHRQYYRLAHDTTDLAKISKLLVAASKGNINAIRNKNLDEINIDDVSDENDSDTPDLNPDDPAEKPSKSQSKQVSNRKTSKNPTNGSTTVQYQRKKRTREENDVGPTKKIKCTKRAWDPKEKQFVFSHFSKEILSQQVPGLKEIEDFLEKHGSNLSLHNRDRNRIKYLIYNTYSGKNRK